MPRWNGCGKFAYQIECAAKEGRIDTACLLLSRLEQEQAALHKYLA